MRYKTAIFSARPISLDKIIYSFGNEIKKVTLGFTPEDISGYNCQELHEKGTTLFLKGNTFDTFGERRIMFPTLSHA